MKTAPAPAASRRKGGRRSQIDDARLRASRGLFAWLSLYSRRPPSGESPAESPVYESPDEFSGRAGEI